MSGFSPDWLGLREAADGESRCRTLLRGWQRRFPAIVDLGAGTGANLRWLAPQLGFGQVWTLVDNDPALLARADRLIGAWAAQHGYRWQAGQDQRRIAGPSFDCTLEFRLLDLNAALDSLLLPPGCLVTASALLDLVSEAWLSRLIDRIAGAGACVLWALSYDGRILIEPAMPADQRIRELVNRHQRGDKGFGPALGPDAWVRACHYLERAGYEVHSAVSDWRCTPLERALADALLAGWAEAAVEISPGDRDLIQSWRLLRQQQIESRELLVTVGHHDLAACPRRADGDD